MKFTHVFSNISKKKPALESDNTEVIEAPALTGPKDCTEIMIGDFIAIICKEKERPDYWKDIYLEFMDLTADQSSNLVLELMKSEKYYRNKCIEIRILCEAVAFDQMAPGIEEVNNLLRSTTRIRGKGRMTQEELNRHLNHAKSWELKADEKANEIKILEDKTEASTKADWYKQLALLGKYQGWQIRHDRVSAADYAAILNNFKAEPKQKPNIKT